MINLFSGVKNVDESFVRPSMLAHQAPRFDRSKIATYRPAFDEGVRQKRVEIEAIVNHPAAPDFTNTLRRWSKAGASSRAPTEAFFAMTGRAHQR